MSQRCRRIGVTNHCQVQRPSSFSHSSLLLLRDHALQRLFQSIRADGTEGFTSTSACRFVRPAPNRLTRHDHIPHQALFVGLQEVSSSDIPATEEQSYRSEGHLAVDVVCRVCPDMPVGMVEPTSGPRSARWRSNPPPRNLGQVEGPGVSWMYRHRTHLPPPPYSITSRLVIIFPPCPSTALLPLRVSDTVTRFSPDPIPRGRGTSTQRRSSDPAHEGGNPGDKSTS